jgi:RimJ/RimL family protein N-acetyltransferase
MPIGPNAAFEVRLRDGTPIIIRAVRADDAPRLQRAFAQLERESVYRRFFTYKDVLTSADLQRLETLDFASEVMLVATVRRGDDEQVIGSASYVAYDAAAGVRAAEIAFIVEEDYQGRGVARGLMNGLTEQARACGIACFVADVLAGNEAMLGVFRRCGLPMRQRRQGGVVHVTLALDAPTP